MSCPYIPKASIIFVYRPKNSYGKQLFPDTVPATPDGHAKTGHSLCAKLYRIEESYENIP